MGRYIASCLPFLLVFIFIISFVFFPRETNEGEAAERVIRVWNVDTFEGGTGSRTAFLRLIARNLEKDRNVYYLVTSYTVEGAEAAFANGELPDMLSFGIGLSCFAEKSIGLPYEFSGGMIGDEALAYPWCRGGYYIFSSDENFEESGVTAISVGGSNLVQLAACLSEIDGENVESTAAYVGFLSGKYRYLLGTQRDICRFKTRGVQVYERPLTGYNDLYQYISILSQEKREDCLAFLERLLSEEAQSALQDIGMLPLKGDESERTVSVFSDDHALENMRSLAKQENGGKNLDKFLKTI